MCLCSLIIDCNYDDKKTITEIIGVEKQATPVEAACSRIKKDQVTGDLFISDLTMFGDIEPDRFAFHTRPDADYTIHNLE